MRCQLGVQRKPPLNGLVEPGEVHYADNVALYGGELKRSLSLNICQRNQPLPQMIRLPCVSGEPVYLRTCPH